MKIFAFVLLSLVLASSAFAQSRGRSLGVTLDSLVKLERSADSLIKYDSLQRQPLVKPKQLASMREIDLTGDSILEVLRLSGKVVAPTGNIQLEFTIKSRGKLLYRDTWKAAGYFDPADELSDSLQFRRLRRYVTVFFANENFVILDSAKFVRLQAEGSPAEVALDSPESREILAGQHVMYSVFSSRDNFYGLVWLPSRKRFVKAWQN